MLQEAFSAKPWERLFSPGEVWSALKEPYATCLQEGKLCRHGVGTAKKDRCPRRDVTRRLRRQRF